MKKLNILLVIIFIHFVNFAQTSQETGTTKSIRHSVDPQLMPAPMLRSSAPNSTSGSFWFSYIDGLNAYLGQSMGFGGVTMLSDTLATIIYSDGQGRPQFFSFAQTFDLESDSWSTFYDGYIDDNGNEVHIPDLNSVNTYTIDSVSCTYAYSRGTNVPASVVDTLIISIAAIDSIHYTQINSSGNPYFRQPDVPYNIQKNCIVADTFPKYQIKKIPLRIQDTTGNNYFNRFIPITGFTNISEKKVVVSMAFKPGNAHTVSSVIGVNLNKFIGYYNEDPRSEFNTFGSTQLMTEPNVSLNAMEWCIDPNSFLYGKYVSNSVWNGALKRPGIGVHVTCNNCVSDPSLTVTPTTLNFTNINNSHNFTVVGQDLSNPTTISCTNSNFVITPTTIYGTNPYTTVSVTFIGSVATSGTITVSSGNLTKYISISATIIPQSSLSVSPDTLTFTEQEYFIFIVTAQNLTNPINLSSNNPSFTVYPNTLSNTTTSYTGLISFTGTSSTTGMVTVNSGNLSDTIYLIANIIQPPSLTISPDTLYFTDQIIVNSFTVNGQNLTDPVTITSYNNNFVASPTTLNSSSISEVITVVFIGNSSTNGLIKVQCGDSVRFVYLIAVVPLPQLPNPVFVPAGGVYPIGIPMNVAILCDTSDVDIYYTSDGTFPSNDDLEYNSPILLNLGITTLKAIAYKQGFLPSDVVTSVYDITNEIDESSMDNILLYPNPTFSNVTIDGGNENITKIELFSMNGQLLYSVFPQTTSHLMDLKSYSEGIYFLKITIDKHIVNLKLLKK